MEIIKIENYKEKRFGTAIALGNFDGLHLGHRELISKMKEEAKKLNLQKSILLFNNHTKKTISKNGPKLLTLLNEKEKIIESLGVDTIYIVDFNDSMMNLSPEKFITDILVEKLNVKSIVVGFDYRFGKNAVGDIFLLEKLSNTLGLNLIVIDPVLYKNKIVSSSEIRRLLSLGNIEKANLMLGEKYKIEGKVIDGNKLGRKLGFPTANLITSKDKVIPKDGIYITNTIIDGSKYKSATSIGKNPTFSEKDIKIETHIIDFNGDLYDKTIKLEFIDFIRDQIKYDRLEDLKKQIKKDIELVCNK